MSHSPTTSVVTVPGIAPKVYKRPSVNGAVLDCLSHLASSGSDSKESTESLHRRAVTMMMMEIVEGRGDMLESLIRSQPEDILRVGQGILNYIIDTRRFHDVNQDHQSDMLRGGKLVLFAIPVCVFSGSMPLSLAVRFNYEQVINIQEALAHSGFVPPDSSAIIHRSLAPCSALWRLRLIEQMMLIPQIHGNKTPDRLEFPAEPIPAGSFAPYMLLGVSNDMMSLLSTVKKNIQRDMMWSLRETIMWSFDRVSGRACTVGVPRLYSFSMRSVIGDFLGHVVRPSLKNGNKITLNVTGLGDDSKNAGDAPVQVSVVGHPLALTPFVFRISPADRQFALQNLHKRFENCPVTINLLPS